MPHGTPDWGIEGPKETVYGLDDLGEHAVRLGSPHLWDRRGDVIWLTDFRNGRGDIGQFNVPASGSITLWENDSRQGAYSVRMGATASRALGLQKWLPYPVLHRIGLEFSFTIDGNTAYVLGAIQVDTGVNQYIGHVRYDAVNNQLQYLQEAVGPTWIPFAWGLNLNLNDGCPHTLKLVIDPGAAPPEYVRAILNDIPYPLAGIPLWDLGTTTTSYLWVSIQLEATADGTSEIGVDNIIVTQNEP